MALGSFITKFVLPPDLASALLVCLCRLIAKVKCVAATQSLYRGHDPGKPLCCCSTIYQEGRTIFILLENARDIKSVGKNRNNQDCACYFFCKLVMRMTHLLVQV